MEKDCSFRKNGVIFLSEVILENLKYKKWNNNRNWVI